MYSLSSTDAAFAGLLLAHPLAVLLPAHIIAAVEAILAAGGPRTAAEREVLDLALFAIRAGEALASRRTA
jgi:hypothetical protein